MLASEYVIRLVHYLQSCLFACRFGSWSHRSNRWYNQHQKLKLCRVLHVLQQVLPAIGCKDQGTSMLVQLFDWENIKQRW